MRAAIQALRFPGIMALAVTCFAIAANSASAQQPHRELLRQKLQRDLVAIADSFDGVLGAQIIDLTDNSRVGINDALIFPQGSAIKIPILIELFRQAETRPDLLVERRPVTARVQTGGSGVIRHFADSASALALEDLAVLMIVLSDNTATNMLIDELGMEAVNRTLARLGVRHTRLQRRMIRPDASARGEENLSTPAEAAQLMARLARCELPVSGAACRRIREILELPKGGPVRAPIPGDVAVAFKPGGIEGVETVWALVALPDRPYALAVMTNYGGPRAGRQDPIRRVSEVAYGDFYKLARATPYGTRVPLEVIRRPPP
ncbi:MAG: serine hydrolase [Gemmatimonadales bacterium]